MRPVTRRRGETGFLTDSNKSFCKPSFCSLWAAVAAAVPLAGSKGRKTLFVARLRLRRPRLTTIWLLKRKSGC